MPGRPAGYALLGLSALLVALAVASGLSGASRLTAREGDAGAVLAAATGFVEAYGHFDASAAGGYRARLLDRAAGELRDALARSAVASDAARLGRATSTDVESASVTALASDTATVHVVALQRRRWTDPTLAANHQVAVRQHLALRLVEEQGRWLVAELRLLSDESASATGR